MKNLYNVLISLFDALLPVLANFSKKLKTFHQERITHLPEFEDFIRKNEKKIIWVHVASLGEYEQAVPVLEKLKLHFVDHAILISFFSDSGFRAKVNSSIADHVTYLPLDTLSNAKKFVNQVNPVFAVFVKNDIWPNFLYHLYKNNIKTYLISARLRQDQIYFKKRGKIFRNALTSFDHIFVQNIATGHYLNNIDYTEWTLAGDTRYDRVSLQLKKDNTLDFMNSFIGDKSCFVCGSTWKEGHDIIAEVVNTQNLPLKYVIVPHKIEEHEIEELQQSLKKPSIRYTAIQSHDLSNYDIIIVDKIGVLNKFYSYADIAYVGGGFGDKGLHNILEPAVFGMPIIIGPVYNKFPEAVELRGRGGLKVITNSNELFSLLKKLTTDKEELDRMSRISKLFVKNKTGATPKIIDYIIEDLKFN